MRTKFILPLLVILMMASVLVTSCSKEDGPTEQELAQSVEQTLAAMQPEEEEPTEVPPTEVPPTATPEPTPIPEPTEIPHTMIPGEPPAEAQSEIFDADSSVTSDQAKAAAGDNYQYGLFERPFAGDSMDYRPDLDITRAILNTASDFVFVEITLQGQHADGGLQGTYGFELDLNKDGRGDILVLASNLQTDWSTDGVFAWEDSNGDVGGETPVKADSMPGDGYDTILFAEGVSADPDLVWARVSPGDPTVAQLAYKPALARDTATYLWWAVADNKLKEASMYDYNDQYTLAEAGSPIAGLVEYPVKAVSEIDNTCSWSVGYTPEKAEPRMCGVVGGLLPGEEVTLQVFSNASCSGPYLEFNSVLAGDFSFAGLAAGLYCVKVVGMECDAGAAVQVVTVPLDGDFDWGLFCEPAE